MNCYEFLPRIPASICLSLLIANVTLGQVAETTLQGDASEEALEWFEREVRPVLAEQCLSCHSAKIGTQKGGLSLDSLDAILTGGDSGPAVVPGKLEDSLLVEAIRRESYEMPPEKPLKKRDREILEQWVAIGAPWPNDASDAPAGEDWLAERQHSHWAWRSIAEPAVPELDDDNWSTTPIDTFILNELRREGVQPVQRASPATLLRRLHFDLTGLPPTDLHLADELSESDYIAEVDRLLSSPQFGIQWGRHWLDLVRYAETLGHEFDYPIRNAWRYRDAVINAFNEDIPYDQFTMEHLAGDQLQNTRVHPTTGVNETLALTGFWWLGDSVHAPVDINSDWATRVDNQIDVVSKTFMGMTIACARCHDHKFDAISVDDYYGLAGVIESSRRRQTITDPHQRVAQHNRKYDRQLASANATAQTVLSQADLQDPAVIRDWLDSYVKKLQSLDTVQREEELSPDSFFYPLRSLFGEEGIEQEWEALRTAAQKHSEKFERWLSKSVLFADFSDGLPNGWSLNAIGRAGDVELAKNPYREPPTGDWFLAKEPDTFDWYSSTSPLPNRLGLFSSQRFGLGQSVTLQSPTFDLPTKAICLKIRGKSTQSSVSVNNFFMNEFHQLLFGDTRKPIDQPSDSGWVTHRGDLNKYVGMPTFISIEDEGSAWFEIEEVRFADAAPPIETDALARALLERDDIDSSDRLLGALAELISGAFGTLSNTQAAHEGAANNQVDTARDPRLATELVREVFLVADRNELRWETLKALEAQRDAVRAIDATAPEPVFLLSAHDGTPRDSAVAVRGNPSDRDRIVPRTCFTSLAANAPPSVDSSGRLELAHALVDPAHPLTARVIVNRVWHHLMGRGIVRSPDNLGVLGGRPTHPELLDYLAAELVRHDWSLKWLVREIALSSTYRLSSVATPQQIEIDADGALWSHRPVRRLTAESVRDAMLSVVGSLDHTQFGPSVPVHLNEQMTGRGRPKDSGPLDGDNRRSIFVEVRRNFLDPFLLAFDFPMPSTSVGNRTRSNVPAQALGMLNAPLVTELAKRWAASTKSISDSRDRVAAMLESVYSRPASDSEIDRCLDFLGTAGEESWLELAHVLLNSKEFAYVR